MNAKVQRLALQSPWYFISLSMSAICALTSAVALNHCGCCCCRICECVSVTVILSVIALCVVICRRAPASVVYCVWYTAWRGGMCSACTRRQATRHCVIRTALGGADTSDKGRGITSRSIQSRDGCQRAVFHYSCDYPWRTPWPWSMLCTHSVQLHRTNTYAQYKKLSYRWQTARRVCAIANG